MNRQQLGRAGEDMAVSFLAGKDYKIIERNFRIGRFGEIDIIAEEKGDIVFIEVKRRTNQSYGIPQESIDAKKQERIIKLGLMYVKMKGIGKNIRFDVLSISNSGFELIKNAFISERPYTF